MSYEQAWERITQIFRILHAENVTLRRRKLRQIHDFHTKTRKNTVFQVFQFNLDELTYRKKKIFSMFLSQVFDGLP